MLPTNECDEYVCKLSKKFQDKARIELGETEEKRNAALEEMREWIRQHPDIEVCRMGTNKHHKYIK